MIKIIDIHPRDDWYDKYYNVLLGLKGSIKYVNRYDNDFYSCVIHLKKDLKHPIGEHSRYYNDIPFRGIKFMEIE